MSLISALALALLAGPSWAGGKLVGASAALPRTVEQAGGKVQSGGGVSLHGTVGGVGRSAFAGALARIDSGYIPLAAQPGTITAITALSKSTGTLELSWTAPGRDGFVGDVAAGAYRVDYSSEAAHAFSTSNYKLDFTTTNVVAGSKRSIVLTGLLPNTTYYTRVYLADSRRFFAEDSKRSDESTLTDLPVSPAIAARSSTTVTIVWSLPATGAAGFNLQGSSTNFGPGGVLGSSRTDSGTQVSLKLAGLAPNTTYFFKVASLNWQGEPTFASILSTVTINSGSPVPPVDVARTFDSLRRTVNVTWTIPPFNDELGVLVLLSTSPATPSPLDGQQFVVGQALSDGAVVKSTSLVTQLADSGLALDTTYFYHLFTDNGALAYSVGVSTALFLDLPPMAPTGLSATPSVDGRQFSLSWRPVTSSSDGTPFASAAAPKHFELTGYDIFRATSILSPGWVRIGTVPATTAAYFDTVPDPTASYAYKVEAADTFGPRDAAMMVDTQRNVFVFADDHITRVQVPSELLDELSAANNRYGKDLVLRAEEKAPDAPNGIFRAVDFGAYTSPGNERIDDFAFSKGKLKVVLHYAVAGGQVVPSAYGVASAQAGAAAAQPPAAPAGDVAAAAAAQNLGMYWFNGAKYMKLFGKVDPVAQTVAVDTSRPGRYEIRALERPQGFHFDGSQLTNKAITPNGDGNNDTAVFVFDNPADSAVSGEIYDLRGGFVASMSQGPLRNSIQWDAKASGNVVPAGIYVYVIKSEDKKYTGTLVVIR